jgi:hypothetical protein
MYFLDMNYNRAYVAQNCGVRKYDYILPCISHAFAVTLFVAFVISKHLDIFSKEKNCRVEGWF